MAFDKVEPTDEPPRPVDSTTSDDADGTAAETDDQPRTSDMTDDDGLNPAEYIYRHNRTLTEAAADPNDMPPADGKERRDSFVENDRLINADKAEIDPAKITEYALNPEHPVGGNKARVFEATTGHSRSNAPDLISQIQDGVMNNSATAGKVDEHGARFTVDMPIHGPAGTAEVRTGWIFGSESDNPRLVTLYVK